MPNTLFLPLYRERITELNDLVWFHQFAQLELETACKRLSPAASNLYTSDIFNGNPHSPRLHVQINKLKAFRDVSESALHAMTIVQVYELLADYLDNIYDFLAAHGSSAWAKRQSRKSPEQNFSNAWRHAGYAPLPSEMLETFTYLRLRRHHYAHAARTCSVNYTAHAKASGARLNAYWSAVAYIGPALAVDFTGNTIFAIPRAEMIDLIRICNFWLAFMDSAIWATIDLPKLLSAVAKQHLAKAGGKRFKKNKDTVEKLGRTLRTHCRGQMGWSISQADSEKAIWAA